jgi:hypothetical protein
MRQRMKVLVVVTFAGGALTGGALREILYNVPLLLAYDVLRDVLRQMKRERLFAAKSGDLGPLVDAAKGAVPWVDWDGIRKGVATRNEIAHKAQLRPGPACLEDIARIETQLVAWKILDNEPNEGGT